MAWTHKLRTREVIHVDRACSIEVDRKKARLVTIRGADGKAIVSLTRKPGAVKGLMRRKT